MPQFPLFWQKGLSSYILLMPHYILSILITVARLLLFIIRKKIPLILGSCYLWLPFTTTSPPFFFYLGFWFLLYCIALLSKVLDDYPCRQPRQEVINICPMLLLLLPKGRYFSMTMALFSIKPRRTPRIFVNIALHERKQI